MVYSIIHDGLPHPSKVVIVSKAKYVCDQNKPGESAKVVFGCCLCLCGGVQGPMCWVELRPLELVSLDCEHPRFESCRDR